MNKKLFFLSSLIFISSLFQVNAQSAVSVNPLTGAGDVSIPIYTVSSGNLSVPISLTYSGTGIKTMDVEGTAGMGWLLNAGGQVSRQVRGIPDDCTKDNTGAAMLGWMIVSNTGADYARSYTVLNNGVTCSNGATDVTNLNSNVPFNHDTEPDIFSVSAPGLNVQLVYDRANAAFHPVNYQDLVISYTTVGGTGNNSSNIATFTITNDKGVKYVFSNPESITETTYSSTAPNYFTTRYKRYSKGITYSDAWNLINMTDANGNGINWNYQVGTSRFSTDTVALFFNGSTAKTIQYQTQKNTVPQLLNSISRFNVNSPGTVVFTFTWASNILSKSPFVSTISGMGRNFKLTYTGAGTSSDNYVYLRYFLTNLNDKGCGSPVNYQFNYYGVDLVNQKILLDDSVSNHVDYWGYYSTKATNSGLLPVVNINPSANAYPRYAVSTSASPGAAYTYVAGSGASRVVNPTDIINGSLNTITYTNGGYTTLIYEPNDYYDVPSNSTVQGGGIRVKQTVDNAGNGSTINIVHNYSYINPATGFSSGEPISLPQYAFTIPYSGTATGSALWTNATALSAYDLSTEDHTIMYSTVKVSQPGAGSTVYNYYVPATYWNVNATPDCTGCATQEWAPSTNNAASYNCSVNNGPIANLPYSFPFIPNPNYDFERGLPLSVINYTDAGGKVSEQDFTYQRSYTPTVINAFASEDCPATPVAKFYNKYAVYYNTSELAATVTKKVFDSKTFLQAQSTTITFSYGSPYHKLLTKQSITNSDNSILSTYFSYVKDFTPNSAATNVNINALYNLKLLNINAPVESYQQVTHGTTTVTTASDLTLYSPSINGSVTNYLPSRKLKIQQANIASFTPFSINTSAQTISPDPNYFTFANYGKYDNTGRLVTFDDNNKNIQTGFYDQSTQQTTAIFKNANYNEVAFNDFDSQIAPGLNTFTISGSGGGVPLNSHAGNAAYLYSGQTVTSSLLTKNSAAANYIFSIWINSTIAGSLTFNLTGLTSSPKISYAGNGAWTYYELKIPVSTLSSTYNVSFTSDQSLISIDDILFYPDVAEANTSTFDAVGHYKIAETNTNGISAYYINDQWGRMLYTFDQDKNLVQRKAYVTAADVQNFAQPVSITSSSAVFNSYTPNDNYYTNHPINFGVDHFPTCFSGVTYTWNFGDGSPTVTEYSGSVSHSYTNVGSYTLTLTVSSPYFTTQTVTRGVHITDQVQLGYSSQTSSAYISQVQFYQGGVLKYTFSTAQLPTAKVTEGSYSVTLTYGGSLYFLGSGTGYGSLSFTACFNSCMDFQQNVKTYTFPLDLTNCAVLNFILYSPNCAHH